jgi:hypothetical protein
VCLKGEPNDRADFLCLCPHCYYGRLCQFSTEFMSITLDSLLAKDVQNQRRWPSTVYITIGAIFFLLGAFNNYCSFITFIRPKPRKVGVGNYLLIVSILNQCSLLSLLLKIIEIVLGSTGALFNYEWFNLYACKIISYLLSVFTRITYWLTSLVSIERLSIVLVPTALKFRQPRVSVGLSIIVIVIVSVVQMHELFYHTTILDPSYTSLNITLCVTNYVQPWISTYNRTNIIIHYFAPFLIQIFSITTLLIQTTSSRQHLEAPGANERGQSEFLTIFKRKFQRSKEYYLTPIIIILSALPHTILSFTYACAELKYEWQRYTLMLSYYLSYLPQILGFFLYVLPSTAYTDEFKQTNISRKWLKIKNMQR